MSLRNIDVDSALRRLAERRIEEAMREGKFDNLKGKGKPLDLEPMPANEDARLAWWALRVMKNADFTPEEVQWRKQVDRIRDEIGTATTEARVVALVADHNRVVHQINTLGTNALKASVAPLALAGELDKLRERLVPKVEPIEVVADARVCADEACRCENPHTASFCRRCGGELFGR